MPMALTVVPKHWREPLLRTAFFLGVMGCGYLLLWIALPPSQGNAAPESLAEGLAALHRVGAGRFGWHRDNTIGSTPQPNGWDDDWVRFWRERRLGFQLDLAARSGADRQLLRHGTVWSIPRFQ